MKSGKMRDEDGRILRGNEERKSGEMTNEAEMKIKGFYRSEKCEGDKTKMDGDNNNAKSRSEWLEFLAGK